jgi:ABC-type multidrug transport system ATPase subunit
MFDKAHILILVSHSEKHILNICNKAIVLNKGELVKQGTTTDCVDYYMRDIVQDKGWTGSDQWMGAALSFKDRKIIEKLSAAAAAKKKAEAASQDLTEIKSFAPLSVQPAIPR